MNICIFRNCFWICLCETLSQYFKKLFEFKSSRKNRKYLVLYVLLVKYVKYKYGIYYYNKLIFDIANHLHIYHNFTLKKLHNHILKKPRLYHINLSDSLNSLENILKINDLFRQPFAKQIILLLYSALCNISLARIPSHSGIPGKDWRSFFSLLSPYPSWNLKSLFK